jgi:hypothetical protein
VLRFLVVGQAGTFHARAHSADLSPTGIQVHWIDPPRHSADGVVDLHLYLPGAKAPKPVRVRSAWRHGLREGLRFVDIADADRLDLAEVLDRVPSSSRFANEVGCLG